MDYEKVKKLLCILDSEVQLAEESNPVKEALKYQDLRIREATNEFLYGRMVGLCCARKVVEEIYSDVL